MIGAIDHSLQAGESSKIYAHRVCGTTLSHKLAKELKRIGAKDSAEGNVSCSPTEFCQVAHG